MIKGLTWANLGWIALSFILLCMIASADGPYKLNWAIASDIWNKVSDGGQGLWKAQGEAAKHLDQATQKRYGYDPIEPRAASCVSSPRASTFLRIQDLAKLRTATDRTSLIALIGEPYCKVSSGHEIWLVGATEYLEVGYNPFTQQLKEVE